MVYIVFRTYCFLFLFSLLTPHSHTALTLATCSFPLLAGLALAPCSHRTHSLPLLAPHSHSLALLVGL